MYCKEMLVSVKLRVAAPTRAALHALYISASIRRCTEAHHTALQSHQVHTITPKCDVMLEETDNYLVHLVFSSTVNNR